MADQQKRQLIRSSRQAPYDAWISHSISELSEEKQDALLRAREHSETLKHRGRWSQTLIAIVVAINLTSLVIVIAIGLDKMHYDGNWAVPSIIAANFAETWALTKIAMKFYFKLDETA